MCPGHGLALYARYKSPSSIATPSTIDKGLTLEMFIEVLEEILGRARQARPRGLALGTFLKVLRDESQR